MHDRTTRNGSLRREALGVLLLSGLLLLAGTASGAFAQQTARAGSTADLVSGMIAFDQAYIPALALSNLNKQDAALRAVAILKDQWQTFSGTFAGRFSTVDWKQGFDRTEAVLANSEALLKKSDLAGAHAALEEVRNIWVSLRETHSIPYFIDYLNRYHESMEEVTAVTAGRTSATLDQAQVLQVEALLPEARRRWEAAVAASFDGTSFGFSASRTEDLRRAEQAVLQGIGQVELALQSGERDVLIRVVEAMKPAFTKTFLMFGNFERLGA